MFGLAYIGAVAAATESFYGNRMNQAGALQQLLAYQAASAHHVSRGECEGCGAPWVTHPLQNALAKGANECSYCRRPR